MKFPHTATIHRKTKSGTKYTYGSVGTTKCFLQPLSPTEAQTFSVVFSQASKAYIPIATTILSGDRLIIDSITYGVQGIASRPYGNLAHKYAVLERV